MFFGNIKIKIIICNYMEHYHIIPIFKNFRCLIVYLEVYIQKGEQLTYKVWHMIYTPLLSYENSHFCLFLKKLNMV